MKGQGRIGVPVIAGIDTDDGLDRRGARLIGRVLRCLAAAALVVLAPAGLASAQQQSAESIRGFVRNATEENGETVRAGVEGVTLTVVDSDGTEVGSATTDADGAFEIPVPGPGDYTVLLDTGTLPDGVALADEADAERAVNVRPNENQVLNYNLGSGGRHTESRWDQLPQTIANGIKFGLIIAITAVGLSLIYGTTGLSNFAHGELVALGAIVTWWMNQSVGLHVLVAALFGIAAAALAGFLMETGIWRPLRGRGTSLTSMMIVSIGIGLAARYLYLYLFGGRSQAYRQYAVQRQTDFGPVSLTDRELVSMIICVVVLLAVALFLQRTRQGKAVRAVSDNPDLASATGINTNRVILLVWVGGGALAGLGGVLLGLDEQVRWNMGFTLLLLMFAAITLGGLGNPYGALLGSLVVGLMVELWTWIFPSAVELKTTGALFALIVILLIRPQGLLGRKERVG
jgi:neutral amino acid transport system permease protein